MPTEEWREANKDKLREYRRQWYANNKERAKQAIYNRRAEIRDWYNELKTTLNCNRCGENHPATLDFHHSDPNEKDLGVSESINNGWSKDRIIEEINKCEVLCSNCHRKEHNREFGVVETRLPPNQ